MYVKCYELMKLPVFKNIHLAAGASGLNRLVSWPYVSTTPSLRGWIRGGELVFIVNNDDLTQVLEEAVLYHVAGVVVLKNDANRSCLNDDLIDFANLEGLPLFEMDYDMKLVDVTREVGAFLMNKQKKVNYLDNFFHTILFSDPLDPEKADNFMLHYGFHSEDRFFITTLHTADPSRLSDLQLSLQPYIEEPDVQFLMIQLDSYLALLAVCRPDHIKTAKTLLKSVFPILKERFPGLRTMTIGSTCDSLHDIRSSYQRSMKSTALCTDEIRIIDYETLGFERLLLNAEESDLAEYAKFVLGAVKEYDEENDSSFLKTMETFILFNGNISKTASRLYIHKNTCIYRIARIGELFQIDLNDPDVRADVLNCLKIYRFLDELK